mmetsp:Transcript_124984/g.176378  ORF Transcript_124984/g.176378 Transcript_124984/m.176378 type:complete len:128 (+) Transcript_124984:50-433(+)
MFSKHSDINPEGPNPYIRKVGNHLYHKDEIPRHLRHNDQRRDKEVLDNFRNIWTHANQSPIVTDGPPGATTVPPQGQATRQQPVMGQQPVAPTQFGFPAGPIAGFGGPVPTQVWGQAVPPTFGGGFY